jgi:hypothetical protein
MKINSHSTSGRIAIAALVIILGIAFAGLALLPGNSQSASGRLAKIAVRLVDSGDVFLTRQQTGQSTSASNFRDDVNASGIIDSGDVFIVRQHTATSIP